VEERGGGGLGSGVGTGPGQARPGRGFSANTGKKIPHMPRVDPGTGPTGWAEGWGLGGEGPSAYT